jgi:hypothetical protein
MFTIAVMATVTRTWLLAEREAGAQTFGAIVIVCFTPPRFGDWQMSRKSSRQIKATSFIID